MTITTYASNKTLDHMTNKAAWTSPTVYVALFTVAPTIAGGGTEAAYTGYARAATTGATWNSAATQATSNASAINFPACTAGSSTVVAFGLYDASTAGNLLHFSACSLAVSSGITPSFAAGQLTLSAS